MAGEPVELPVRRSHPFDPPPELAQLRDDRPVCPLRFPDGGTGWLVTGHAEVRQVLTDPRFSARHDLRDMPPGQPAPPAAAPGFFVRMDPPEHTRYRRLVTAHFTRRRLYDLAPRIAAITEAQLDLLEAHGAPADLVQLFGLPIPSLVIGEILGVGDVDRDAFQAHSRTAVDLTAGPEEVAAALSAINALLADVVLAKQRRPGDDVISALLAAGGLSPTEVATMAFLLLVAGHETTANMATVGIFALLCHPSRHREFLELVADDVELTADDSRLGRAVDELLRYVTINQFGALRVSVADGDFAGQPIRQGDALVLSLPAANRDPAVYPEPDRLQLDRSGTTHLAFGHGAHLCSGAQLARLELRIMYAHLLRRFPHLQLAVTPQQVPLRLRSSIYGVSRLPVDW